jgi:hypothetical protein
VQINVHSITLKKLQKYLMRDIIESLDTALKCALEWRTGGDSMDLDADEGSTSPLQHNNEGHSTGAHEDLQNDEMHHDSSEQQYNEDIPLVPLGDAEVEQANLDAVQEAISR